MEVQSAVRDDTSAHMGLFTYFREARTSDSGQLLALFTQLLVQLIK